MRSTFCRRRYVLLTLALAVLSLTAIAGNSPASVSDVRVTVNRANQTIKVSYLLTDKDNPSATVDFRVSADGGVSYTLFTAGATGDVGKGIRTGRRSFSWNYGKNGLQPGTIRFQLIADDGVAPDPDELIRQVDTARMRRNLQRIAIPRDQETNTGRANLEKVRATISGAFQKGRYELETQSFEFGAIQGKNLIGRKKGTEQENKIYVLCSSYDGMPNCPAANNNASGVAGMMEIAEILSGYSFKNTVVVLATDYTGEEFIGSNWFVFHGGVRDYESMEGAIDLDRIGTSSDQPNTHIIGESKPVLFPENCKAIESDSLRANFLKVISNDRSMPLVDVMQRAAGKYEPRLTTYVERFPGYGEFSIGTEDFLQFSDHISFWYNRYKAIWITDAREGIRRDNTPDDTIDKLNFHFMGQAVRIALGTLIELAGLQHATTYQGSFQL